MTTDELRQALSELNGERDATFGVVDMPEQLSLLSVHNAMLVPDEPDHLVKLTDGRAIYILDAQRIAWVRISLPGDRVEKPTRRIPIH